LHAFEDAKMTKCQGEWRIMIQIGGCRCLPPPAAQAGRGDPFLELVRGFGALEVPAEWRQQLMVLKVAR
jgi:hypothetical protein